MFKRTEKVDKKIKRRIVLLLLGAFFAFWWIFRIRGTTNILKSIYFYFCGGLAFFSKHYIDYKENFNETIFWGTYQGLLRPIIGVLEVLGIQAPKLFDEATSFLLYCQKNPIRIASDGSTQNYFTTCFAYYYLDGRIIGVCMHSLIYGTLCGYCYKLQKKNKVKSNA